MSAAQTPSPQVAPIAVSKPAILWHYTKRAGRLALVVWLLWFGGWLVVTLQELFGNTSKDAATDAATQVAPANDPATVLDSLSALDAGGRWSFVDGNWSLGVVTLSTNEFAPYWAKSPADPTAFGEVGHVETTVLDLVRQMELAPEVEGPRTVYRYESAGVLAEVATLEVAGRPRLAWGRLATQAAPGEWKVLETRAAPNSSNANDPFVVPAPSGTERLAARYDAAGTLRGEFLFVAAGREELLQHWRTNGCRPTAVDLDEAQSTATPIHRYDLNVAGRPVHAVVWNSQTPDHTMLLALPQSLNTKH